MDSETIKKRTDVLFDNAREIMQKALRTSIRQLRAYTGLQISYFSAKRFSLV